MEMDSGAGGHTEEALNPDMEQGMSDHFVEKWIFKL